MGHPPYKGTTNKIDTGIWDGVGDHIICIETVKGTNFDRDIFLEWNSKW